MPGPLAVETFLAHKRRARNTLSYYRAALLRWLAFCEAQGIAWTEARRHHVHAYVETRNVARQTVGLEVIVIRKFYAWCEAMGLDAGERPERITSVRWRQPRLARVPRFLMPVEVEAMLAVHRDDVSTRGLRDQAIIELFYASGLRLSELVALDVEDLDFDRLTVHVRHGKGDRERYALMHERCAAMLRRYLSRRRDNRGAVFLNRRGGRLSARSVGMIVSQAGQMAGIARRVTPHQLRHSMATHLSWKGADIRIIQQLLGHAQTDTTAIYVGILPQEGAARRVQEALDAAHAKARRSKKAS